MESSHGLRVEGSRFWVIHRRRVYGPFDYEWSKDFCGMELMFQGDKFGEYCSCDELFADLKPYDLPLRVAQVASLAVGTIVQGILDGRNSFEREEILVERLEEFGFGRYSHIERRGEHG